MRRLSSILLWSVIAAAFIGPGTVTTAAVAGSKFGLALLWALLFSTAACLILQEASGRLAAVTGRTLGQALRDRYSGGVRGALLLTLVLGAIVLGCAAYQAGNILGGVAGAALVSSWPRRFWAVLSGVAVFILLWSQAPRTVAKMLSIAVAIMGVAFLVTAWKLEPGLTGIVAGLLTPSLPGPSAGVIVLGLIGTTVVPYNLFLGSGLARGERLADMRLGLVVAVGAGGVVSMGVLVVGTAVAGDLDFANLAEVLGANLGSWARLLFGMGLFAAGVSSAITAPLAAAITAQDLLGAGAQDARWDRCSWRYRAVWGGVLAAGMGFGLSDVQPIPVIVLAQALNGLLLPLAAVFLLIAVNDRAVLADRVNGHLANLLMAAVVVITLLLGSSAVWRAVARLSGGPAPEPGTLVLLTAGLTVLLAIPVQRALRHGRRS